MSEPEHRTKEEGRSRYFLLPFLAWLFLLAWLWAEGHRTVERHRQVLRATGRSILTAIEVGIRSMGRRRASEPEFLGVILGGMASAPHILGVGILDGARRTVAGVGNIPEREVDPPGGERLLPGGLLLWRPAQIGYCPFDGEGRPRVVQEPEEVYTLACMVSRVDMDAELALDLRLRMAIGAAGALIAAAAALGARARRRNLRLGTELALLRERSRSLEERAALGAGLAHETKNPLNAVRGFAQLLALPGASDEERRGHATRIIEEVDRAVARINEFLAFSRAPRPHIEEVALTPLFADLAGIISPELDAKEAVCETAASDLVIRADRDLLRRLLLNLLVNAADAIPGGGKVRLLAEPEDSDLARIVVEDNGRGIPAQEIDRVFEPYYTLREGGTGLGLAIVAQIAEAQGWRVRAESRLGAGTRILVLGIKRCQRAR